MSDTISIIIPVYNVESYIRKCLNSVISQTYKNLEILLIDDGSTDESGKICGEYAVKDKRIRLFHKENGGASSARNLGLKNFTGQYVGFVDSDDWIEPDMYETLYNLIKEKNVFVSAVGFFRDTDTKSVPSKNIKPVTDEIISQKDLLTYAFRLDYYNAFHIAVWNKIFSADIFKNNNMLFDENLKIGEDSLFTTRVFLTDNCTGAFIDKPMYHYCQRGVSLFNSATVETKTECAFNAYKTLIKSFEEKGHENLMPLVKKEYCYNASLFAEAYFTNGDKAALRKMQEEIKVYLNEYVEIMKEYPERIERIKRLLEV